jgi:hypothetical protein
MKRILNQILSRSWLRPVPSLAFFALSLLFLSLSVYAPAQRLRTANLSEKEIEEVRESSIFPTERVKIYTRIIDERANKIKDLTNRPRSAQRVLKLDDALQDFTALMDEVGSNLDQYSDRHSDIRKALKPLTDATPRWLGILRTLPGESGFDLARKEAIESGEELGAQANRLLHEQDEYFATHKDEKNQERNDDDVKPLPPPPKG